MTDRRIDLVDALRGYALLGLLLVHCYERFEVYWLDPRPDAWVTTVAALFGGKAYAIFALLFGFSFATIMGNERARGGDFTMRYVWRLVLLAGFALFHQIFYLGDILQVLALVGLLLVPADRISSNKLLLALAALAFAQLPLWIQSVAAGQGAAWALELPFSWIDPSRPVLVEGSFAEVAHANLTNGFANKWSFYWSTGRVMQIAGLFLVGMVLQRTRLFAEADGRRKIWVAIMLGAAIVWAAAFLTQSRVTLPWPEDGSSPMQAMALAWVMQSWQALAATAFQVSLFVLLWHLGGWRILQLLAPPGRMTLTLYVGQSLVLVPLFYGYGAALHDDFTNAGVVLLGLGIFAAQIALASYWFRFYRFGPFEWLWRAATRTTLAVPFRKTA